MEYTSNYHLPQWVETDRIMMGDFNDAMASLESGITTAQAAADSAQQEAEEKGFVIGSYTGNGEDQYDSGQLIELGFRPRFVIITRGWIDNGGPEATFLAVGQPRVTNQNWVYELRDNGFVVKNYTGGILTLNLKNTTYDYIAFK